MEKVFSDRTRNVIQKYTSNTLMGVFIGIILGANIGTTFSSQLIAMDIGRFAFIPLLIGLIISFFARSARWKNSGEAMLYFGMLFFGLYVIESSVEPLRKSEVFLEWLTRLDNPVSGALTGGLVTLIIQSSSATVGLAIVLGKQNLLSLAGGIAVMLGAELGTCSDTMLATIKGSRNALRAGVFHLGFNLITIVVGLLLIEPFVALIEVGFPRAPLNRQIANAHVIFNVIGVLIALPFTGLADKLLTRLIPDKRRTAAA